MREEISNGFRDGRDQSRHKDSAEIRREIGETRAEMDQTIDRLQTRLAPGHLLDDALDWLRGRGRSAAHNAQDRAVSGAEKIAHVARENPVPLALVGAGVTWLIVNRLVSHEGAERYEWEDEYTYEWETDEEGRPATIVAVRRPRAERGAYAGAGPRPEPEHRRHERTPFGGRGEGLRERSAGMAQGAKERAGEAAGSVGERVREAGGTMRERAQETGERVREGASEAAYRVRRGASMARQEAERLAHEARVKTQRGYDRARRGFRNAYEENPLAIAAIGMAAGLATALLIPSSRREDRLMGDASDEALSRTRRAGKEMLGRGQEAAMRVGEETRAAVDTERLREDAREVSSGLQGAADDAIEQARRAGRTATQAAKEETRRQIDEATSSEEGRGSGSGASERGPTGGGPER